MNVGKTLFAQVMEFVPWKTFGRTYVLITIIKKELHLDASLYTLLQILSVSVFEKTLISCALQTDDYKTEPLPDANQLILLGF